jgi:hypothetical protein
MLSIKIHPWISDKEHDVIFVGFQILILICFASGSVINLKNCTHTFTTGIADDRKELIEIIFLYCRGNVRKAVPSSNRIQEIPIAEERENTPWKNYREYSHF